MEADSEGRYLVEMDTIIENMFSVQLHPTLTSGLIRITMGTRTDNDRNNPVLHIYLWMHFRVQSETVVKSCKHVESFIHGSEDLDY